MMKGQVGFVLPLNQISISNQQVNCSSQMEVVAVETLLNFLQSKKIDVGVFATDRSTTVRKLLKNKFPHVKHNFDPWYYSNYI